MSPAGLRVLADSVLLAHVLLALFLTLGLAAILIGGPRWRFWGREFGGWRWVRGRAFRVAHLVGMAVVAAEALLGVTCPLTDLESLLRSQAGGRPYPQSFIGHWLSRLLFYDLDEGVFAAVYAAALGVTVWAWRRWGGADN